MKIRWKKVLPLLILACVIIAVFMAVIIFICNHSEIRVHPDEVRPWAKDDFEKRTVTRSVPEISSEQFFKSLRTEITSDSVTLSHPSMSSLNDAACRFPVINLPFGGGDLGNGASLEVKYISTAFLEEPYREGNYLKTQWQYYNMNGSPLSEEDLDKAFPHKSQRTAHLYYNSRERVIRYYCDISGMDNVKIAGSSLYDQRTKVPVSPSSGCGNQGGLFFAEQHINILHSTPMLLVLDLVYGESETKEIEAVPGTLIEFSNAECRLEAVIKNSLCSMCWGNDYYEFRTYPAGKEKTSLLLSYCPGSSRGQFEVCLISDKGSESSDSSMGPGGLARWINFNVSHDNVQRVQIKYYPEARRFIIPVGEMPGLPESNRDIDNLLNVTVPFKHFNSDNDMRCFLEGALELRIHETQNYSSSMSKHFPREYSKVKVEEIFQDYVSLYPDLEVKIMNEEGEIELKPRETWIEKTKKFVRKILPFI